MKTRFVWLVGLILVLVLALTACQPATEEVQVEVTRVVTETVTEQVEVEVPVEVTRVVVETETETVTEEVVVEVEKAPLGSEDRPVKVLFVPSVDVDEIISGGEVLSDALTEATGLNYEVIVPTSYAATIEEMCASPDDTVGFIPAQGYVLANNRCGVTVGAAAIRFGLSWYTTQYVVSIDSEAQSIEDLAGASWCIPDYGSTSGYLYPQAEFVAAGIEPGEIIETGGHPNAMLGVYNGECDFATGYFTPPLLPFYERQWTYGVDDPEIWREAELPAERTEEGRTFIGGGPDEGGYRLLDSRAAVTDTAPDIYDQTRVLGLTAQIPNDTISFGPEFPLNTANEIVAAMVEFAASDACLESICSDEFYNWTGVEAVADSFYDPVRSAMDFLGITEEEILGDG
jgi:phosphonate transport system substrate-binding protein